MKNLITLMLILVTVFVFTSCTKNAVIEQYYYDNDEYAMMSKYLNISDGPKHSYDIQFPNYVFNGLKTSFNYDKALLGRVLFYDKNLSSDGKISCGSCHKQEKGFSDDVAFSQGSEGKVTTRNSLALGSVINFNLYYGSSSFGGVPFFWDNSANSIQEQSMRTIQNPNEMNMHISDVEKKINSLDYYKPLAKKSYGATALTGTQILDAISEFTNSISNFNTKFDNSVNTLYTQNINASLNLAGYDFPNFTVSENLGKNLYMKNCASCHNDKAGRPDKLSSNNGLYETYTDLGMGTNGDKIPMFKVPTLRNIALTAPYMHDGSIKSLGEVIDHYSTKIKNNIGLDPLLMTGNSSKKMNFTATEKQALLDFLGTMTDNVVANDEKFSNPFK